MTNIQSYFKSARLIYSLVRYNKNKYSSIKIYNSKYIGFLNSKIPLKILEPKKNTDKVFILYPGASPFAEEHPKMLMLGHILANHGFKVYIPRIPPLKKLEVTEENINWFLYFYKWLIEIEKVKAEKIIMTGISYGGGLMLKMLINNINTIPMPKSIMTFGTYSDAKSLFNFLLNGKLVVNDKEFIIEPNEWGLIVLFHNYLKKINLDWDTSKLQKAIEYKVNNFDDNSYENIKDLPKFQQDLYRSIVSGKADFKVKELANIILENETDSYKKLSPEYGAEKLTNKIFILHGANDSMVPFTQSIQLAQYLPNSELCISYLIEHREVSKNRGLISAVREIIKIINFYSRLFFDYEN